MNPATSDASSIIAPPCTTVGAGAGGERSGGCATPQNESSQSSRSEGAIVDVEMSLARAIAEASAAGRFDVVAQLARELEARRLAAAGNIVRFEAKNRPSRS
jgi:hypothetical protein